jgi:raffinose synthase
MKKKAYIFAVLLGITALSCNNNGNNDKMAVHESSQGISISADGITYLEGLSLVVDGKNMSKPVQLQNKGTVSQINFENGRIEASILGNGNFIAVSMSLDSAVKLSAEQYAGVSIDSVPQFSKGVSIWRYKPWNSWTKPIGINNFSELKDWDIQFFYWQYENGLYGAIFPLSGNGFRTTLGQFNGNLCSKSKSYVKDTPFENIPQFIAGFGNDPYVLFEGILEHGLAYMGKEENLVENKTFPERLEYIGWCTWNSSDKGHNLNEEHVLESVKSFSDSAFQLGWVIVDDGWFNNTGSMLNSFYPNPDKFPKGFKSMNKKLKEEYGIKEMGLWHAFNGYWNGINPDSEIGRRYKNELFSWDQKERPDLEDAPIKTYHFIKPGSDSLQAFYNHWHKWMVDEGFTFVKVDNQLVTERMAVDNYPIFDLS